MSVIYSWPTRTLKLMKIMLISLCSFLVFGAVAPTGVLAIEKDPPACRVWDALSRRLLALPPALRSYEAELDATLAISIAKFVYNKSGADKVLEQYSLLGRGLSGTTFRTLGAVDTATDAVTAATKMASVTEENAKYALEWAQAADRNAEALRAAKAGFEAIKDAEAIARTRWATYFAVNSRKLGAAEVLENALATRAAAIARMEEAAVATRGASAVAELAEFARFGGKVLSKATVVIAFIDAVMTPGDSDPHDWALEDPLDERKFPADQPYLRRPMLLLSMPRATACALLGRDSDLSLRFLDVASWMLTADKTVQVDPVAVADEEAAALKKVESKQPEKLYEPKGCSNCSVAAQ